MVGAVQSEGYACVNHVFTVAYGTCNTEHYLFVRTIVCADCCSVFTAVVAIACGEGQFVVRIKVHRMQCCQSCCACANLVYTATKLVDAVGVVDNLIFNAINAVVNISFCLMQLAAVDSILGIFFYLTVCYVGNILAVCIQALIVDIGLVANFYAFIADGGLACGYSSCSYAYVFTNIQAILIQAYISTNFYAIAVHYSIAGGYGLCSYSINVDGFIQLYLIVCSFTFFSSVVNSNIFAAFYFSVLSCSCCYVGKFLIQFADCGSSAIAICNITFFYLAVLQIANLGVQLVVQVVYSFNNGSLTFAAVFKIVGNIINIAYITCFCYVGNGYSTGYITFFINNIHRYALRFIASAVSYFTNYIVATLNMRIVSCNIILQLAYVYCVGISFACCYTGNLAACYIQATADGCSVFTKHDGFCTIISTDIAHANTAVSNCKVFITIGNDDAIFIQVNFGISIGNRGNISQIACNINLVISLAVFNCRFNCCILTVR